MKMSIKMRMQYSSEFKARIALKAVRGKQTLSELSRRYEVPDMIAKWKRQFPESAPQIFVDKRRNANKNHEVKSGIFINRSASYR